MASTNDILSVWEKVNQTYALSEGIDPYQGGGTDPNTATNYRDAPRFGPGPSPSNQPVETSGDSVDARIASSMGDNRMIMYIGIGVASIVTVIGIAAMMRS